MIASALDLPIDLIECEARSTTTLLLADVRWLLDRLGIASPLMQSDLVAQHWSLYYRRYGASRLRGFGFRVPRRTSLGHAFLLRGRRIYDPLTSDSIRLSSHTLRVLDWVGFIDPRSDGSPRLMRLRASAWAQRDATGNPAAATRGTALRQSRARVPAFVRRFLELTRR